MHKSLHCCTFACSTHLTAGQYLTAGRCPTAVVCCNCCAAVSQVRRRHGCPPPGTRRRCPASRCWTCSPCPAPRTPWTAFWAPRRRTPRTGPPTRSGWSGAFEGTPPPTPGRKAQQPAAAGGRSRPRLLTPQTRVRLPLVPHARIRGSNRFWHTQTRLSACCPCSIVHTQLHPHARLCAAHSDVEGLYAPACLSCRCTGGDCPQIEPGVRRRVVRGC
jgi:hypothetical protein